MYTTLSVWATAMTLAAATPLRFESRQTKSTPFLQNTVAWDAGAVSIYPIHSSCNSTQAAQINAGLNETILLAEHAKDHVLRWGNSSELYQKYFGKLPPYEIIGAYDQIVSGDKGSVLFRCDNPDNNCRLEGWAGHWRGSNATGETVICDLSYQTRRFLSSMCGLGYTVGGSKTNVFWASDLMHRLYHMPAIGYGYIEHYVESYDEALAAAKNSTTNGHDSNALQYFALDTYAYDIAVPGVGCSGEAASSQSSSSSQSAQTSQVSQSSQAAQATVTPTATATISQAPSQTSSAAAECHTHDDGAVHCT